MKLMAFRLKELSGANNQRPRSMALAAKRVGTFADMKSYTEHLEVAYQLCRSFSVQKYIT